MMTFDWPYVNRMIDLTPRLKVGVNHHRPVDCCYFLSFSSSSCINHTRGISLLFIMMDVYEASYFECAPALVVRMPGDAVGRARER